MFAAIGKFLQKNIVEPIDKAVIKPIDKAIVRPVREATDKDYALRHERARIAKLQAENANLRPAFFTAQQDLAEAIAAYERASEDFSEAFGAASLIRLRGGAETMALVDPRKDTPEALQVAEDVGRFMLKTVSLGLSEALINLDQIPRERAILDKQIAQLKKERRELHHAINHLETLRARYDAATKDVRLEHAMLGADITKSDVHVHDARTQAQTQIVERLLTKELPPATIAAMTGIAPEFIAQVTQISESRKEP